MSMRFSRQRQFDSGQLNAKVSDRTRNACGSSVSMIILASVTTITYTVEYMW